MRFLSFEHEGRSSWGRLADGGIVDLGRLLPQFPTLCDYIGSPEFAHREALLRAYRPTIALAAVKFEPVITRPEKIVCLARSYMDHHKEAVTAGWKREIT